MKNKSYFVKNIQETEQVIETISDKLIFDFKDHSDVVDWNKVKEIGLKVEFLKPEEEFCRDLMEVYERFHRFMRKENCEKMFFNHSEMFMYSKEEKNDLDANEQ